MIARCDTCPFWHKLTNPAWGRCCKTETDRGYTRQDRTLAVAKHQEDNDRAWTETHVSFGCVMHPTNKAIA